MGGRNGMESVAGIVWNTHYEWEKQPVPIIHGFPVRAALPRLAGANWVKWLVRVEVY